jgi:hypothetical protein
MSESLVATRPRALALGRVAASLALASAVVHVLLLEAASLGSIVMVLMAGACLPCAWHLWHKPTAHVWRFVAVVDVTMLLLHLQMAIGARPTELGGPHSLHGMENDGATGALMWFGVALTSVQLILATAASRRPCTHGLSPDNGSVRFRAHPFDPRPDIAFPTRVARFAGEPARRVRDDTDDDRASRLTHRVTPDGVVERTYRMPAANSASQQLTQQA